MLLCVCGLLGHVALLVFVWLRLHLSLRLRLVGHVLILGVLDILMVLMLDLVVYLVFDLVLDLMFDLRFDMGFGYALASSGIIERSNFHGLSAWGRIYYAVLIGLYLCRTHILRRGSRSQSTAHACAQTDIVSKPPKNNGGWAQLRGFVNDGESQIYKDTRRRTRRDNGSH